MNCKSSAGYAWCQEGPEQVAKYIMQTYRHSCSQWWYQITLYSQTQALHMVIVSTTKNSVQSLIHCTYAKAHRTTLPLTSKVTFKLDWSKTEGKFGWLSVVNQSLKLLCGVRLFSSCMAEESCDTTMWLTFISNAVQYSRHHKVTCTSRLLLVWVIYNHYCSLIIANRSRRGYKIYHTVRYIENITIIPFAD